MHIVVVLFLRELTSVDLPLAPGTWWDYREVAREKVGPPRVANGRTTRLTVRGSTQRPYVA